MEQGTAEWFAARCGRFTASRMGDLCARVKSGWGASHKNYLAEIVVERLTGKPYPSFETAAMRWGTEQEPSARNAYVFDTDREVTQVGFVEHPTIPMAGGSPDGLIGDDGILEIKCPNTATHIETLLARKAQNDHLLQCQWNMACTGRAWADYVSYDPRMPPHLMLLVLRVPRDDALIASMSADVISSLTEVETIIQRLNNGR